LNLRRLCDVFVATLSENPAFLSQAESHRAVLTPQSQVCSRGKN